LGFKNSLLYCAAKHGVLGMMKVAKREVKKYNIRVNTICPAKVDTTFFKNYEKKPPKNIMIPPKNIANLILAAIERKKIKFGLTKFLIFLKRLRCIKNRLFSTEMRNLSLRDRLNLPYITK
jgi:short-subunit dehydrogenase